MSERFCLVPFMRYDQSRLVDRAGEPVHGVHYVGPWLRARDWEATAVGELRRAATTLVDLLLREYAPSMKRHQGTKTG